MHVIWWAKQHYCKPSVVVQATVPTVERWERVGGEEDGWDDIEVGENVEISRKLPRCGVTVNHGIYPFSIVDDKLARGNGTSRKSCLKGK